MSLIEVLIALSIFSVAILGAGLSSLQSLRITQESLYHSYALIHAQTLGNFMQFCLNQKCDSQDLETLKRNMVERLPNANVSISIEKNQANVAINWTPRFGSNEHCLQFKVDKQGFYLK